MHYDIHRTLLGIDLTKNFTFSLIIYNKSKEKNLCILIIMNNNPNVLINLYMLLYFVKLYTMNSQFNRFWHLKFKIKAYTSRLAFIHFRAGA